MKTLAIIGNILWLGSLLVMFTLGGVHASDIGEQAMLVAMTVPPIINIIALNKVKIENRRILNSLPFLYLKRKKLEQQKKIKELES